MKTHFKIWLQLLVVVAMGITALQPAEANAARPCSSEVFCSNETACADLDSRVCDDCTGGIVWKCEPATPGSDCNGYLNMGFCGFATK